MFYKCPGQDRRNIGVEFIKCCCCGYEVEIFSDETKRRCPSCGTYIFKQLLPSCILWCKSAADCVGKDKLENLNRGG